MQFHEDKQTQQFVKMFHFEEFDVFDYKEKQLLHVLRKPLTSILKTTYV